MLIGYVFQELIYTSFEEFAQVGIGVVVMTKAFLFLLYMLCVFKRPSSTVSVKNSAYIEITGSQFTAALD